MAEHGQNEFGALLRQAREAAGMTRDALSDSVGMDASYIYRLEVGNRRPSRDAILSFVDALQIEGEDVNKWLLAAGYAPMPLLMRVRGAVRTRGARSRVAPDEVRLEDMDAPKMADWFEAMGLQESMIGRLIRAMDFAGKDGGRKAAEVISRTILRVAQSLEAPVRRAVIPAAGGHHRLLASHVMQRLLQRAVGEAAETGISEIAVVLPPGTEERLFDPIREALSIAIAPALKLHAVEQPAPLGLGDAILRAETFIGDQPFAVVLPDDVIQPRIGRSTSAQDLSRMMQSFSQLEGASLLAVASVPKSKMTQCGVAKLGAKEALPDVYPVHQLIERPDTGDSIYRSNRSFGIVGRYLLSPEVIAKLHKLKEKDVSKLDLTAALDELRSDGKGVYGIELKGTRQDIGEAIDQAKDLIGTSTD